MRQIEDKLSLFVKEQFPSFYNEEGEMFQIFLKAYYEFLEQENSKSWPTQAASEENWRVCIQKVPAGQGPKTERRNYKRTKAKAVTALHPTKSQDQTRSSLHHGHF